MKQWTLPVLLTIEMLVLVPYSGVRFESPSIFLNDFGFYLSDLCATAAPLLILSFGMTLVLMTAGIDLSIGSMVALIACILSLFDPGLSFWVLGIPCGFLLAIGLGWFNGWLIAGLDIPPIIATLGTLFFYRGLCEIVIGGRENISPAPVWLGDVYGSVPLAMTLTGLGGWYFYQSRWRREIQMLGGNRIAARYAGIPVQRRIYETYLLMGILALVAALCASARDGSVKASWQTGLELQVIVAVILGGTPVHGGSGTIRGSLIGVFIISVLELGLMGLGKSELKPLLLGFLLVTGVALNTHFQFSGWEASAHKE